MIKIPRDRIHILVTAEDELDSPEILERMEGFAPGFAEAVHKLERESPSDFNWCTVRVMATIKDAEETYNGCDYLGACSYRNKQDFIENSGYYEDMVATAIKHLHENIVRQLKVILDLGVLDNTSIADELEQLADGQDDDLGNLLTRAVAALRFETVEEVA